MIKLTIFVSAFHAILLLSYYSCLLIWNVTAVINVSLHIISPYYDVLLFSAFLYTCMNPITYVTKFEPVKQILFRMIPRKETSEQANENVANARISLAVCRAVNAHAHN